MIGNTISHYKILQKLGQGGMGEVYLAEDTKLKRKTALKFLPLNAISTEEDKSRFVQEAQAAASLNHPNIATVYGIDEHEGESFIAMEYVEGQTLKDKIHSGPLKLKEAIDVAIQIAQGLHVAHEKGIIHRDIKSANIMLTQKGQVKIMDFGLAKVSASSMVTKAGTTLGTVGYMSPEQSKGEAVDHRSDIWSLGVVLYEMISGLLPFKGEYETAIIYSIQSIDPDPLTAMRTGVPIPLEKIVVKMLAKDFSTRYQHVDEIPVDLKNIDLKSSDITEPGLIYSKVKRSNSFVIWRSIAIISLLALFIMLFANLFSSEKTKRVERWNISLPESAPIAPIGSNPYGIGNPAFVVSPDGTNLVYVADIGGNTQLYLRKLDGFETQPLSGTEGAYNPFFSPDGKWIGFFANDQLKKISIEGGSPIELCEVVNAFSASWGINDKIVFVQNQGFKLSSVSSFGGTPENIVEETRIDWPEILPEGNAIVASGLKIIFLDTGEEKELPIRGYNPKYVSTGHLLFTQNERVMAVSFDLKKMKIIGSPVSVIEDIRIEANRYATQYTISNDGTLLYQAGTDRNKTRLLWLDRKGNIEYLNFATATYGLFQISPDGHKLAIGVKRMAWNVWIYDLDNKFPSKFTDEGDNNNPIWTPDGEAVVFNSYRDSTSYLFMKQNDGIGAVEQLTSDARGGMVYSSSPDGNLLSIGRGADIMLLQLNDEKKIIPHIKTDYYEWGSAFSPDGRWIAYVSSEKGKDDVYVQPYPPTGERWFISTEGGEEPVWSRATNELFYRNKTKWMVVKYKTDPNFVHELPTLLFVGDYVNISGRSYDVSPDGRFLLLKGEEETSSPTRLNVVVNWFEELKENVKNGNK